MKLFPAPQKPARVALTQPNRLGKRLLLGMLCASFLALSPTLSGPLDPGAAHALGRGNDGVEKVIRLRILRPKGDKPASEAAQETELDRFEAEKAAEMTQLTARRIRTRLKAAGIKDFSVTSAQSRSILVRVRGNTSRQVVAGIVVPRGRMELRPIEPAGTRWVRALADLPVGVELRQKQGSFDANQAYLWSADAEKLHSVLRFLENNPSRNIISAGSGLKFTVFPDTGGGWRTLTLSAPIATHDDVASASIRQGKTGESYVQLLFENDLSDALLPNGALTDDAALWAVLLDGEVVSVLGSRAHHLGSSLNITAPEQLGTRDARQAWAQQVAGRLAAYIPVPLIEDRTSTPKK